MLLILKQPGEVISIRCYAETPSELLSQPNTSSFESKPRTNRVGLRKYSCQICTWSLGLKVSPGLGCCEEDDLPPGPLRHVPPYLEADRPLCSSPTRLSIPGHPSTPIPQLNVRARLQAASSDSHAVCRLFTNARVIY